MAGWVVAWTRESSAPDEYRWQASARAATRFGGAWQEHREGSLRLGLWRRSRGEFPRSGVPASAGTFSWGGAASTFFWVDREEDVAVVFMTQLVLSETWPLRAELLRGVNAALSD